MKFNSSLLFSDNSFQKPKLASKVEIPSDNRIKSEITKLKRDLGFENDFQQHDISPDSQTNTSNPNDNIVNSNEIYRCLLQRDKIDDDTGSESGEDIDTKPCLIIYPNHFLKQIFDVIIIM
jgi:hypothetical protein